MSDQLLAQVLARVDAEGVDWLTQALEPAGTAIHSALNVSSPDAGVVPELHGWPAWHSRPPAMLSPSLSPVHQ